MGDKGPEEPADGVSLVGALLVVVVIVGFGAGIVQAVLVDVLGKPPVWLDVLAVLACVELACYVVR
jgi:uncharacterized protein (DUF983 family)